MLQYRRSSVYFGLVLELEGYLPAVLHYRRSAHLFVADQELSDARELPAVQLEELLVGILGVELIDVLAI